jgi:hypothetical protein
MVASEFEYRHRFWMIVLVYVVAYAFYNIDHLNILYSIVPWNQGIVQKDMLVRFLYAAAALLAACGAVLLSWATAYRPPSASADHTAFSIGGPFGMSEIRITCHTCFSYWHWEPFRAGSGFRLWSSPKRSCCFASSRARNSG